VVNNGGEVSFAAVAYQLSESHKLPEIGGLEYLNSVERAIFNVDDPTFDRIAGDIEYHGRVRRIKEVFITLAQSDDNVSPDELAGRAINQIYQVTQTQSEGTITIQEALDSTLEPRVSISGSSLAQLDRLLAPGGWAIGDYVIVAARPSVGKTAMAAQMAITAGLQDVPTLVFSLEQSKHTLMARMRRIVSEDILRNLPIRFNFTTGLTAEQIFYYTQIAQMLYGIKVVVIDYIGLIKGKMRGESTNDFLHRVSETFVAMKKNLNLVIIVTSQLNRDPDKENREPELYDLRDSGTLEQDADIVLFLHRPKKGENAKFKLAKQREGGLGNFHTRFDPNSVMFYDE
jgi:replicative DNA helicase